MFSFILKGEVFKNHRKIWIPSIAVGEIHHTKWRLSAEDKLNISF